MSDKEIFLEKEEFERAIEKLKGYKMVLIDKRNGLIKKNGEMSQNWKERSGMAFALSANVIEAQFKNLIDQINTEIEVLTKVKTEMNRADEEISRDIEVS